MTTVEYDLADRTFSFAQEVRLFLRQTPKDVINFEKKTSEIMFEILVFGNWNLKFWIFIHINYTYIKFH